MSIKSTPGGQKRIRQVYNVQREQRGRSRAVLLFCCMSEHFGNAALRQKTSAAETRIFVF